jgi:hypothetical protein
MSPKIAISEKPAAGQPGRPTRELIDKIVEWLLQDSYFEVACQACGLTPSTGSDWKERGKQEAVRIAAGEAPRKKESPYLRFFLAIEQAEAQVEAEDILYIRGGRPDWQAKAWIRERRNFGRWGKKETIEHTGKDGKPIQSVTRVVDT